MSNRVISVVAFVCLLVCLTPRALAQSGSFSGTVTDNSGGLVPKAKITATNVATGISRETQTDDSGTYRITNVSPGIYDVRVEHAGFKTIVFAKMQLDVDEVLTLDARLVVSSVTENVMVSSSAVAPVDLNDAQTGGLVDSRQMSDLPLILRDPYQLILLSPGAIQTNTLFQGFSVNGSRERSNNFLLDGSDNNDPDSMLPNGRGLSILNPETTQEFRVITNSFLPEFGRNSGAIIDIVSKQGGNDFHADLYWFGRYTALSAKDFFAQDRNDNPFVRNQFGYSVSGPIQKNQTFFFLNQEIERFSTTISNSSIVPTAALKSGVFAYQDQFGSGTVDATANIWGLPLDPTIQQILALYPNPNGQNLDGARGVLHFPSHSLANGNNVTGRIDHDFRGGGIIALRYTYNQYSDSNYQHKDFLPGLGGVSTEQHNHNVSLTLTSSLRHNITNEVHGGANRLEFPFNCTGTKVIDGLGPIDPEGRGNDYPLFGVTAFISGFGCTAIGDTSGSTRNAGTYTAGDTLSWVKGRHAVKFGGEYRAAYSNSSNNYASRTILDFNPFANFGIPAVMGTPFDQDPTLQNLAWILLGGVDFQTQAQFFNAAGTRTKTDLRGFRQSDVAGFGQDSYKLFSNVTFTYGVRYEFFGVPTEVNNQLSTLLTSPDGAGPFTFSIVGDKAGQVPLYQQSWNGVEPRFAAAWDPFGNGKSSVRAGYGIYHDRVFGQLIGQLRGDPPFQMLETLPCLGFFASPPIAQACTLSALNFSGMNPPSTFQPTATVSSCQLGTFCAPTLAYLIDPKLKTPYLQTWNLGMQYQPAPHLLMELNYVGSKGTHLLRLVDGNPPQPALVAQLEQLGVPQQVLQFNTLWLGADELNPATQQPILPFNATNNNAFLTAQLYKSIASSTYHALQTNITKQMSHGFAVQAAYTYAHSIDNASDPLVPGAGNLAFPRNSLNLAREKGNSDFDVRHRLVLNYTWQVPMGRDTARLSEGTVGWLLGNWTISGISMFSSGLPYDILTNVDSEHTGQPARPQYNPSATSSASSNARTQTGPSLAFFSNPQFGSAGNLGRNVFRGPGINNTDVVVTKQFDVSERLKLDLRFEVYNLFNRVQFNQPDNFIYDVAGFGHSTSEVTRPDGTTGARQAQIGMKLSF